MLGRTGHRDRAVPPGCGGAPLAALGRVTNKPHDALFKAAFESPEHAAALLRHLLSTSVSAAIDWQSMALQVGSFIDPERARRRSSATDRSRDRQS
jgi:hypothetical protein